MDSKKLPPNPAAAFWSALRTLNLYYCAQLTFTKLIYVLFNDLSLIIRSAGFADAMRYCESTTLAALDQLSRLAEQCLFFGQMDILNTSYPLDICTIIHRRLLTCQPEISSIFRIVSVFITVHAGCLSNMVSGAKHSSS